MVGRGGRGVRRGDRPAPHPGCGSLHQIGDGTQLSDAVRIGTEHRARVWKSARSAKSVRQVDPVMGLTPGASPITADADRPSTAVPTVVDSLATCMHPGEVQRAGWAAAATRVARSAASEKQPTSKRPSRNTGQHRRPSAGHTGETHRAPGPEPNGCTRQCRTAPRPVRYLMRAGSRPAKEPAGMDRCGSRTGTSSRIKVESNPTSSRRCHQSSLDTRAGILARAVHCRSRKFEFGSVAATASGRRHPGGIVLRQPGGRRSSRRSWAAIMMSSLRRLAAASSTWRVTWVPQSGA